MLTKENRKRIFMMALLSEKVFDVMFEIKSKYIATICMQYDVSRENLRDTLWKEFNIPGMEVRIANTAFDFLIDNCELNRDLRDTLVDEIRQDILMSGIFYTNIEPNALNTCR